MTYLQNASMTIHLAGKLVTLKSNQRLFHPLKKILPDREEWEGSTFLFFGYAEYYPYGGMEDCDAFSTDLEKIYSFLHKHAQNDTYRYMYVVEITKDGKIFNHTYETDLDLSLGVITVTEYANPMDEDELPDVIDLDNAEEFVFDPKEDPPVEFPVPSSIEKGKS